MKPSSKLMLASMTSILLAGCSGGGDSQSNASDSSSQVDTTPEVNTPPQIDNPPAPIENDGGLDTDAPFIGVSINVDLLDATKQSVVLHDMWQVANRISPRSGVAVRPGLKVNTVRMVGGILKVDENGNRVPDIDYDICHFDEATGEYQYNFKRLTDRIDAIISGGTPIHQIVMDQPPWAFQRGYTFIAEGQRDGVNFRENERHSIYGNSLPPFDKDAYRAFVSATIQHLVDTYGESTVLSWRFRIGSEIETPEHWYGTEDDFVAYYADTLNAIRSVLPAAKVGVHTRPPNFVFRNGTITNYKDEVIKSFADALIEYSFDNNLRYDFWGISDYPIITRESTRHPDQKFEELFEGLVTHPKWLADTVIDIEEFSVVSKIQGNELISSDTAQADTLVIAMTDHLYEHGVDQIFQWGQRNASHELWRTKAMKDMAGMQRYSADITGNDSDLIGAIVAVDDDTPLANIDTLIYHYDAMDIEATANKEVELTIRSSAVAGSTYYYRQRIAGVEHKKFQQFMSQPNASRWLRAGNSINEYGNAPSVLNEEGLAAWQAYENPNPSVWGEWQQATTVSNPDSESGSIIKLETVLPAFSFEKVEIRWQAGS